MPRRPQPTRMNTPIELSPAIIPPFTDPDAARVWNYWFAARTTSATARPAADPYADDYRVDHSLWFHARPAVDEEIGREFGALVERAASGALDGWSETPRTAVALVLLLDQFPRHMHRGTARAYAHDEKALGVARSALSRGFTRHLAPAESLFLFMALAHSEAAADAREALAGVSELITRCTHKQQRTAKSWRVAVLKHLHVLERFGRDPHRNAPIGRESTAAEELFLAHPEFTAVFAGSRAPSDRRPAPVATAAPAPARRLKILALHGMRQSGAGFRAGTRKLRNALADVAEFTFVTSPRPYRPAGASHEALDGLPDDPKQQAWWHPTEDNLTYEGFDDAVAFLEGVFRKHGPFDGVLGFSQGGTLAAVLAAMQPHPTIAFSFVICVGAFPSRALAHAGLVKPGSVAVPSAHVYGENDALVAPARSVQLFEVFDPASSVLLKHGGGHFSPTAWPLEGLRAFVEPFVDRSAAPEVSEAPGGPASDGDAMYQVACDALAARALDVPALQSVFEEMAAQEHWRELAAVAERAHARRTDADRERPETSALVAVHEEIVGVFARQLLRDLGAIAAWPERLPELDRLFLGAHPPRASADGNGLPSQCARFAPRVGTRADKVCRLARDVARELFPLDDMAVAIAAMEALRPERPAPPTEHARRAAVQSLPLDAQARNLSYQRYGQALSLLRNALRAMDPDNAAAQLSAVRRARAITAELIERRRAEPISHHISEPAPEPVVPCSLADLDPLLAHLEADAPVEVQTAFSKGTLTTDGRLDLCKQVVGPDGIRPLLGAMMRSHRVKRLLLGNNIVGDGGAEAIAGFIRERTDSPLECWYIAGNHIGPAGIAHVCDALAHDTRVTSLWLKRNPLKPAGMVPLAAMLRANRTIEVLDVVNCGLLDEGLATLLGALRGPGANKTLKHLYLGTNGVTEASAPLLADFVANDCALDSLYLSCNRLGDEGTEVLARGLASNTTLRRVSLASNRVGPRGAAALAKALVGHPSIALLDLGFTKATVAVGELGNLAGDEGARALAEMLTGNTALRSLDLLHNHISQAGVNHLREALKVNRTLTSLQLTQFGKVQSGVGREEIRAALERNRALVPADQAEAVAKLEMPDHVGDIYSVYRTHS
ncbi:MAG: DUF924 family protein [Deltaproteobacteria bacterium]|nr:DUF924 family protein [Myxococcales bacterium]MDP3215235.1 DUF924 family protein [Deltaproteobacteria bacterium]